MERRERAAGVLLHISSLPGKEGIGTLGESAYRFADWLKESGVKYWQILPLVQTGFGDSPYQSAFASSGNPYFIDLFALAERGLLKKREISPVCRKDIDYGFLYEEKYRILRRAFSRFDKNDPDFCAFVAGGEFEDYAVYMAIKQKSGNKSFDLWEKKYKFRDPAALSAFKEEHKGEYLFWQFVQYEFLRQWQALKSYANGLGIRIMGDMPLYVAADSADVWANPRLFKLNAGLKPKKVAGVPPDYFSATGQLWGNPVYDWKAHEAEGYSWWCERIRRAFKLYDTVRIDHFRGFDRYFEIDAGAETAVGGRWRKGPGAALFDRVKEKLGDLDFIAEDLGTLDAGVYRLMKRTGYPGMKVIQFAFDGNPKNPYLPENIGENSVCYTGTHDNDTMLGYFAGLDENGRKGFCARLRAALKKQGIAARVSGAKSAAKAAAELALSVRSFLCVLPMQDILLLGSDSRMNTPSVPSGNWRYRLGALPDKKTAEGLLRLIGRYGRI